MAKIVVVPTVSLAKLVYKAVEEGKLPYNYVAGFYEASGGIGLSLGNAEWLPKGSTYVNPHTRR